MSIPGTEVRSLNSGFMSPSEESELMKTEEGVKDLKVSKSGRERVQALALPPNSSIAAEPGKAEVLPRSVRPGSLAARRGKNLSISKHSTITDLFQELHPFFISSIHEILLSQNIAGYHRSPENYSQLNEALLKKLQSEKHFQVPEGELSCESLLLKKIGKGFSGAQFVVIDDKIAAIFKDVSKQNEKFQPEIVDRVTTFLANKYRDTKGFTKKNFIDETPGLILRAIDTQDINKGVPPHKTIYREKIAVLLARILGTDIVPETTIFSANVGGESTAGTLHRYIPNTISYDVLLRKYGQQAFMSRIDRQSLEDLFILDCLLGNIDRNPGNILFEVVKEEPEKVPLFKLKAIDHSTLLPKSSGYFEENELPCWFKWSSASEELSEVSKQKLKNLKWDKIKSDIEKDLGKEFDSETIDILCIHIHFFKHLANSPSNQSLIPKEIFGKLTDLKDHLFHICRRGTILSAIQSLAQNKDQTIEEFCTGENFESLVWGMPFSSEDSD